MNKDPAPVDNTTPYNADEYDQKIKKIMPLYDFFHKEVLDLIKNIEPDPAVWLDTGCGTGCFVERARQIFPKTHFLLADPSEAMLHEAKRRLGEDPTQDHDFLPPMGSEELGEGLPKVPRVITAIQCHHYYSPEERRLATESCYRSLEPGGLYVTFENIRPLTVKGVETGMKRWKNFQISQGKKQEEAEDFAKRLDRDYFPITLEEHLALLRETGFKVVELFWFSYMQAGFYAVK